MDTKKRKTILSRKFINEICKTTCLSENVVKTVLKTVSERVLAHAAEGDYVMVNGLGTFYLRHMKMSERCYAGDTLSVSLRFRSSSVIKRKLSGQRQELYDKLVALDGKELPADDNK